MSETSLTVIMEPEIERLLIDNGVDLAEALSAAGYPVSYGTAIPADAGALVAGDGQKSVVLVLLGTAAVIAALTPALTTIIGSFANRPFVAEEEQAVAKRNPDGTPMLDGKGKPIYDWVTRRRAMPETHGPSEVEISGLGLRIKLRGK